MSAVCRFPLKPECHWKTAACRPCRKSGTCACRQWRYNISPPIRRHQIPAFAEKTPVIPAKAGIQTPPPLRRHFVRLSLAVVYACPGGRTLTLCVNVLDSRLRGNDEREGRKKPLAFCHRRPACRVYNHCYADDRRAF
ncbi:MAG: hypothetical protein ACR2P4_02370 [Gammaproteobacteria bacterium]